MVTTKMMANSSNAAALALPALSPSSALYIKPTMVCILPACPTGPMLSPNTPADKARNNNVSNHRGQKGNGYAEEDTGSGGPVHLRSVVVLLIDALQAAQKNEDFERQCIPYNIYYHYRYICTIKYEELTFDIAAFVALHRPATNGTTTR